jgi:hypothetical protein
MTAKFSKEEKLKLKAKDTPGPGAYEKSSGLNK